MNPYDKNRKGEPSPALAELAVAAAVYGFGVYLLPRKYVASLNVLVLLGLLAANQESVIELINKITTPKPTPITPELAPARVIITPELERIFKQFPDLKRPN